MNFVNHDQQTFLMKLLRFKCIRIVKCAVSENFRTVFVAVVVILLRALLVHRVEMDAMAWTVLKDLLEKMDQTHHLIPHHLSSIGSSHVKSHHKAHPEIQALKDLKEDQDHGDLMVYPALLENLELKDHVGHKAQLAFQESEDHAGLVATLKKLMDLQVRLVLRDHLDQLDHQDLKDLQDPWDLKALPDQLAQKGSQDLLVNQVPLGRMGQTAYRDDNHAPVAYHQQCKQYR